MIDYDKIVVNPESYWMDGSGSYGEETESWDGVICPIEWDEFPSEEMLEAALAQLLSEDYWK